MRKLLKLSFVSLGLILGSCSELPEYELPYELGPTSMVSLSTNVTAGNAVCPAPTATLTADSESTVYYVIQPEADDALTSDDVFSDGDDVDFAEAGSEDIDLTGLDLGESYTIYAVTVNADGTRSEEVTTTSFTMPSFSEVVDPTLAGDYSGTVYYNGSVYAEFDTSLANEEGYMFSAESLWGDAIAGLTGVPEYAGMFQYPGSLTLNEDFTVDVNSEASYAVEGSGEYDPCTGTFSYELVTSLFDDAETEEVETLTVDVELVPAE